MIVSIVIPIYKPEKEFAETIRCIEEYHQYAQRTKYSVELIIIDSSEGSGFLGLIDNYDWIRYIKISKEQFNHGGTRNMGFQLSHGEFVFYLTQDCMPISKESFINLFSGIYKNDQVGAAYGRQLPKSNADFLAAFARKFNYPDENALKSWSTRERYGIKTAFLSDSFAIYRKKAFMEVNGFPTDVIMNEDQYIGAKLIKQHWSILYVANACVYHSHNYSHLQEFRRYFDIGVFYGREKWILDEYSKAEGEGKKFVVILLHEIIKYRKFGLIPAFFVRNFLKYTAYKLGMYEKYIPNNIKLKISMNKQYWVQENKKKH